MHPASPSCVPRLALLCTPSQRHTSYLAAPPAAASPTCSAVLVFPGLNVATSFLPQHVCTCTPCLRWFSLPSSWDRPMLHPSKLSLDVLSESLWPPSVVTSVLCFPHSTGHLLIRSHFIYLFPYLLLNLDPRPARAGTTAVLLTGQQEPWKGRRVINQRCLNDLSVSQTWPSTWSCRSLCRLIRLGRLANGAHRI